MQLIFAAPLPKKVKIFTLEKETAGILGHVLIVQGLYSMHLVPVRA